VSRKNTNNKKPLSIKIVLFLGSKKFFYIVLGLFLVQAVWLAFSVAYPMLFDEHYHIGVISIYSEQLSPFIGAQDSSITSFYGEISRNPSYLYHYILSFPYRLITAITESFYVQIVFMRLINVLFTAVGLVYFRRLLLKIGLSQQLANISLLIVSLVPVFSLLAAQINYDNLVFMLVPIFLIKGIEVMEDKKSINLRKLSSFILVGVVGSVVKMAFLPIFTAGVVYVFLVVVVSQRRKLKRLGLKDYRRLPLIKKISIVVMLLIAVGIFSERYVGNIISYGAIAPRCAEVQDASDCSQQYLQIREENFIRIQEQTPQETDNFLEFSRDNWIPANINSSLSAASNIGATESIERELDWKTEYGAPVPIFKTFAWAAFYASIIFLIYSFRDIRKKPYFWYMASIVGAYLFALWYYTNFLNYKELGVALAIQSRYILIIFPIIVGYVLSSVNEAITSRNVKLIVFTLTCLFFTQGGGATTLLISADSEWYWQRDYITQPNNNLKELIAPLIKEN